MATVDRTLTQYNDVSGTHARKVGKLTGPASYTTGGDATVTPALLGLGRVDAVLFEPFSNGTVILLARYNVTTSKLQFYDLTGAEIGAGTDLSTYTGRFEAIGV